MEGKDKESYPAVEWRNAGIESDALENIGGS